jgi:hypothetical protein
MTWCYKSTAEMEAAAVRRLALQIERNSPVPPWKITPSMREDFVKLAIEILAEKKLQMGIREPMFGWGKGLLN